MNNAASDSINKTVAHIFGTNSLAANGGYPNTVAPTLDLQGATIAQLHAFQQQYGLIQGNVTLDQRGFYRNETGQTTRGAYDIAATPTPVYTIIYIPNGGDTTGLNLPATYTIEQTPLTFSSYIPTRTGYVFTGWNPSELAAGTMGDTIIKAQWVVDTFDVTFYRNGIDVETVQRVAYLEHPSAVIPDSTGYGFVGWHTQEGTLVSLASFTVFSDTALYAKWISNAIPTYKVYFDVEDIKVDSQTVEQGSTATAIAAPNRSGYVFEGWYAVKPNVEPPVAGILFNFSTPIYKDTTVYAIYTKQDTIPLTIPVFTPNSDSIYYDSVFVSITCENEGASIYYTIDGSTPTESSIFYSAPFELTIGTTIVKAIAVKENTTYIVYVNSDIATAQYVVIPVPGPEERITVEWAANVGTGDLQTASPAMSPDKTTLYFSNGTTKTLYAINASDGTNKWYFSLGNTENSAITSSVSVNDDGTVYAPTGTGGGTNKTAKLFAVNPDGTEKWVHEVGDGANIQYITPVITKQGNIILGNRGTGGSIRTINAATGAQIDKHAKESENIVATQDGYVYAMARAEGNGISTYQMDDANMFESTYSAFIPDGKVYAVGAMAVDANGNVYGATGGGSSDGSIFSIKRDGFSVISNWQYPVPAKIEQSGVVIGLGGSVYVNGAENNKIYAFTPDGQLKWVFATDAAAQSVPAIDNNGNLHFGDNAGNYYIIKDDQDEATLLHKRQLVRNDITANSIWSSPLIDSLGKIYLVATCLDGNYLFKISVADVTSPANSPWAMKGGNIQRTGLQKKNTSVAVETENTASLSLYPNPASEVIIVSGYNGAGTLQIYDVIGKCVMSVTVSGEQTKINISSLSHGAYLVKCGNRITKFIKK
jgi:uncharacterized repeat protein (TIGR02543 family)